MRLQERYPEIFYQTLFSGEEIKDVRELSFEDIERWKTTVTCEKVEVLYVYGLGKGRIFSVFKQWLDEHPQSELVFLEEELSCFSHLERENWLAHPRVHLFHLDRSFEKIRQIASQFPVRVIQVIAHPLKNKARFVKLKQVLQQATLLENCHLIEALYQHFLFNNTFSNLQKLPHSFSANKLKRSFEKVPAIICGAGPSLDYSLSCLQEVKDKALILAGGSTLTALTKNQIKPHFACAIDPNPTELERLQGAKLDEIPFLYAFRLFSQVFNCANGPWGYLQTPTMNPLEEWIEKRLGLEKDPVGLALGEEAMSVTLTCLAYAEYLGCNPIILTGIDLAYTENKNYAEGIVADNEIFKQKKKTLFQKKGRAGKKVYTHSSWLLERKALEQFIKTHSHLTFLDCTSGGLELSLPYQPLREVIARFCTDSHDLTKRIKEKVESSRFNQLPLQETFKELQESFLRVKASFETYGLLAELLCEEETAYQTAIAPLKWAFERLRFFQHLSENGKKEALLNEILTCLNYYLTILSF